MLSLYCLSLKIMNCDLCKLIVFITESFTQPRDVQISTVLMSFFVGKIFFNSHQMLYTPAFDKVQLFKFKLLCIEFLSILRKFLTFMFGSFGYFVNIIVVLVPSIRPK